MAGPGGGPPRRSHTKSRKGCETCKRRHIRCDENFPQCRNCTKHNCRCPYMDMSGNFPTCSDRPISPERADLMWNSKIETDISYWQQTGNFPFPSLFVCPTNFPQHFSTEDLRLFYHIASVSSELGHYEANHFTIWTRQVPIFLSVGKNYMFVMHALLALSATHLAWLTKCAITASMAYEHRGIAMTGLHKAIGTFSKINSDAVLATSLLLSWQESDWPGWTQLMHGTSSVIEAMQSWKDESQLQDFIDEQNTFLIAPPSPALGAEIFLRQKKHLNALHRAQLELQKVQEHFGEKEVGFSQAIKQLKAFIQDVRKVSPQHTAAQLFEMLDPLRAWLFWQPVMFLQKSRGSASALVIVAYYYTIALVVEPLFPEVGAAYFGSLTLNPIEAIARHLSSSRSNQDSSKIMSDLMKYPIDMVSKFKLRMSSIQSKRTLVPSALSDRVDTCYLKRYPTFLSLTPPCNPILGYNQEQQLDILSEPQSATSLASDFNSTPYLNIPSPYLYESCRSPDSFKFEEGLKPSFNVTNSTDSLALYDNNEHDSSTSFTGITYPATSVWI